MPRTRMTLHLDVHATVEIEEGIGKTKLTHPKLDGELYFIHSLKGGSEIFLEALDENPISAIFGVVSTFKEIANEANRKPASNGSADGLPASTYKK